MGVTQPNRASLASPRDARRAHCRSCCRWAHGSGRGLHRTSRRGRPERRTGPGHRSQSHRRRRGAAHNRKSSFANDHTRADTHPAPHVHRRHLVARSSFAYRRITTCRRSGRGDPTCTRWSPAVADWAALPRSNWTGRAGVGCAPTSPRRQTSVRHRSNHSGGGQSDDPGSRAGSHRRRELAR